MPRRRRAVKSSVDSDYYACMPPFVDRPREKQTVGGVLHTLSPLSPGLLTQQIQFISNFVTDEGQILLSAFEN